MTKRVTTRSTPSRRGFVKGMGGVLGTAALAPVSALAQQPPNAAPVRRHPPSPTAAAMGTPRTAKYLSGPGHHHHRSVVRCAAHR